ncbi:hypothetical protein T492DRAFT_836906 [Pavlovales sp. CCMP2436]|nr:hypothetical protein T492DRAFT_836906 [Pavlovales sp. CCMP2436]
MRASFGTADGKELPHVCYPLASTMDRITVTAAGEKPPVMGGDIPEALDSVRSRKKGSWEHGTFKTGFTYTMSFHSAYVDLVQWEVCNLPGLPRLDLKQFWGNMPFHFVCYDLKVLSF